MYTYVRTYTHTYMLKKSSHIHRRKKTPSPPPLWLLATSSICPWYERKAAKAMNKRIHLFYLISLFFWRDFKQLKIILFSAASSIAHVRYKPKIKTTYKEGFSFDGIEFYYIYIYIWYILLWHRYAKV